MNQAALVFLLLFLPINLMYIYLCINLELQDFDSEKDDEEEEESLQAVKQRQARARRELKQKENSSTSSSLLDTDIKATQELDLCLFKHKLTDPLKFPEYHSLIYSEAKSALAKAKNIARSHLIIENRLCRKALNELLEILEEEKCATHKLSTSQLKKMSIAKLQIIVNHLHSQIEGLLRGIILLQDLYLVVYY